MNKKAIILWVITFLWMGIIFSFSATTGDDSSSKSKRFTYEIINIIKKNEKESQIHKQVEKANPKIRKIAHAFEYAVLYILVLLSLKETLKNTNKTYLIALILCVLYASTDEVHQLFVNGRSGELRDVVIDTAGAVIGLLIYEIIKKASKKLKEIKG